MCRACVAFLLVVLASIILGAPCLTIGLLLPPRWCFEPLLFSWCWVILLAAGIKLTVEGRDQLGCRHVVLVGNDQSALDVPVMGVASRGRIRFMAKKSLFHLPIIGWLMYINGFVPIDRSNARRAKVKIDDMLSRMTKRPFTLLIFPEGTRSEDDSIGEFKTGSIQVCQRTARPILPFAIRGTRQVHKRRVFRLNPGPVHLAFGQVIEPEVAAAMPVGELKQRVHDDVLRLYERDQETSNEQQAAAVLAEGGR